MPNGPGSVDPTWHKAREGWAGPGRHGTAQVPALSGTKVEGYVDIAFKKGMAPNDVTNADASVTLVKYFLERLPYHPTFTDLQTIR